MTKRLLGKPLSFFRDYFVSIGDTGAVGQCDNLIKNYEFCKKVITE